MTLHVMFLYSEIVPDREDITFLASTSASSASRASISIALRSLSLRAREERETAFVGFPPWTRLEFHQAKRPSYPDKTKAWTTSRGWNKTAADEERIYKKKKKKGSEKRCRDLFKHFKNHSSQARHSLLKQECKNFEEEVRLRNDSQWIRKDGARRGG